MSTAKRLVATLRGRNNSSPCGEPNGCNSSSSTRLFGPNPRGSVNNNNSSNNELDEIAIVSNAEPCQVKYGSGPLQSTANGPRLVPGIITTQGRMIGERLSASGMRLNSGSPVQYTDTERRRSSRSVSRQSLLDLVNCRLGRNKQNQRYFSTSRDSLTATYRTTTVTSTASELDLSKKARKKDLRGRLKLPPNVVLLPACGSEPLLRGRNWGEKGNSGGGNPGTIKPEIGNLTPTESDRFLRSHMRLHVATPNWSFVFDPAGETIVLWFCLDYMSDLLYLIDIVFHFRTGYLEDGVLQTDAAKLRNHYMNSTTFYIDCLCLLPLDFLYLSIGFNSILRTFRLVKIYRFWAFMDRTERHTNYPNLFRSISLIHYLLVIFHWNGCLHHIIYKNNGFGSKNWVFNDNDNTDVVKQYLQSYYWCTLSLTTIGDLPRPRSKGEYLYVIVQLLFGLMLFATVLGHVANIVTNVSAARKEFQDCSDVLSFHDRC
ncbi:hypothetical protein RUM44_004015 [Polyplax serrata]|uniref:Ion transport domain-containing protein n=1 Tax=Polyplax serrata TaxID=468196 RepID=A0ABR1B1L9_POLSC